MKTRGPSKKYSKRWSIECSFRDTKDPHFGMGMSQIRINSPERRDRLWLLNALAVALLTLLGAAGEALGFDKTSQSQSPQSVSLRSRRGLTGVSKLSRMKRDDPFSHRAAHSTPHVTFLCACAKTFDESITWAR
jgi:hypothetical protein